MDPLLWMLALSTAMFFGAFLAGLVPLSCSLSTARVRSITILGAGLLIGTALIVVIPEGINMWFASHSAEEAHQEAALEQEHGVGEGEDAGHDHADHGHGHGHDHSNQWQIGAALAIGFAFMIVVDRIGGDHAHGHGHSHGHGAAVSDKKDVEEGEPDDASAAKPDRRVEADVKSWSATLGLLIHAAVDGVALGSAALTNSGSLSLVVFMAIMLHKAPAAFGLASFLLHSGMPHDQVKQKLLWFAGAAPAGAIGTFCTLGLSGEIQPASLALLLVFSGGTFLYVSTVHILPDLRQGMRKAEVMTLVAGVFLPLIPSLMNLDHGH